MHPKISSNGCESLGASTRPAKVAHVSPSQLPRLEQLCGAGVELGDQGFSWKATGKLLFRVQVAGPTLCTAVMDKNTFICGREETPMHIKLHANKADINQLIPNKSDVSTVVRIKLKNKHFLSLNHRSWGYVQ